MQLSEIHYLLRQINSKLPPSLLRKNNLDPSGRQLGFWRAAATKTTYLLDANNVEYTLMKAFDVPQAYMVDVDLLIEDESNMIKTISILKKENYAVKKLHFFYPFKLTGTKQGQPILIDLYHKPKWYDFTYGPRRFITSLRERGSVHGVNAFLPPAEMNIYIVATHGYSHGRFTLEEILHIISVLLKKRPKLSSLLSLVNSFRTGHALYCYLWLANRILEKQFGYENIELEQFLQELERHQLTRYFSNWIKLFSPLNFRSYPIYVPPNMLAFSGLTKLWQTGLDHSVEQYDEMLIAARHFSFSRFLFSEFGQILQSSL